MEPVDLEWRESVCRRELTAANFATGGLQHYDIDVQSSEIAIQKKTYMRFLVEISGAVVAGTVPTIAQQIALAEGCISNCYTQGTFSINGVIVSVVDPGFPQASAIEARTGNSAILTQKLGSTAFGYNRY